MKPLEVASVIQVVFNLSQPTVHQIKVLVILTERKCRKLLADSEWGQTNLFLACLIQRVLPKRQYYDYKEHVSVRTFMELLRFITVFTTS